MSVPPSLEPRLPAPPGRLVALVGSGVLGLYLLVWPLVRYHSLSVFHLYSWPWWVGVGGAGVVIVGALSGSRRAVSWGVLAESASFFADVLLWLPALIAHRYIFRLPWVELAWWAVALALGFAGLAQMSRGAVNTARREASPGQWVAAAGGAALALTVLRNATQWGPYSRGPGFSFEGFRYLGFAGFLIAFVAAVLLVVGAEGAQRALVLVGSILATPVLILQVIFGRSDYQRGPSVFWWAVAIVLGFVGYGMMSSRVGGGPAPVGATSGPAVGTPEWRVAQIQAAEAAQRHFEEESQQWAQAYRDSHDGAEPPADFHPPVSVPMPPVPAAYWDSARVGGAYPGGAYVGAGVARQPGTNVFAILALIFGLMGGLLAIPFGFVALSQIKRTHEGGRGMAITGLVFAFSWIGVIVALYAWAAALSSNYSY